MEQKQSSRKSLMPMKYYQTQTRDKYMTHKEKKDLKETSKEEVAKAAMVSIQMTSSNNSFREVALEVIREVTLDNSSILIWVDSNNNSNSSQ
jgi:hypothetical protein